MLTKEIFIQSIELLEEQFQYGSQTVTTMDNDADEFNDNENLIEVLLQQVDDPCGLIEYYINDLAFGENYVEGDVIVDNKAFYLQTAEDLWSLLTR